MAFIKLKKNTQLGISSNRITIAKSIISFTPDLIEFFNKPSIEILVDTENKQIGFRGAEEGDKDAYSFGKKTKQNSISLPYIFSQRNSIVYQKEAHIPLIHGTYIPEKVDDILVIKNCFYEPKSKPTESTSKKPSLKENEFSATDSMFYFSQNLDEFWGDKTHCEIIITKNTSDVVELSLKPSFNKIDGRPLQKCNKGTGRLFTLTKEYRNLVPAGRHEFKIDKENNKLLVSIKKYDN